MSTINEKLETIKTSVQTNMSTLLTAATSFISFFDEHYLADTAKSIPYLKQLMKDKVIRGVSHD